MIHNALQTEYYERLVRGFLTADEISGSLAGCTEEHPDECTTLASVLLNVSLDAATARTILSELLAHHRDLCTRLDEDLDIRVAAMDYATRHPDLIGEPVLVDHRHLTLSNRLAAIDELTGLFNRRFLDIYLAKEVNRARRYHEVFSILFLDIDDFKRINDLHGHEVGDQVLAALAGEIQGLLRREDFAARYGGEEFLVVLPHTDDEGTRGFAGRLDDLVRNVDLPHGVKLTFSGGIASFPLHGSTPRELLRNADAALYQAKINGKGHARTAPPEKRAAPRHPTDVRAVCYLGDDELGEVKVHDISYVGISALAGVRLPPGKTIRFRIMPRRDLSGTDQIDVYAQIIWDRKVDDREYQFGGKWETDDTDSLQSLIEQVVSR